MKELVCAETFAGTRVLYDACGTTGNDVELGLTLGLLEAVRVADCENPATLTAAGSENLLPSLGFGTSEEAVAAETLALFELTDHSGKNE